MSIGFSKITDTLYFMKTLVLVLFTLLTACATAPQPTNSEEGKPTPVGHVNIKKEVITTETAPRIRGESDPWSLKSFLDGDFSGTDFTIGNLLTDWGTHKSYYSTYRSDGLKISATFHVPNGEGPFPVLILNHGYFPPEDYTNGYGFGREQKHFARLGYAVLHIDYRGYGFSDKDPEALIGRRFGYTGYSSDAVNAVLALKAANLAYLDMSRVGVFGHSLGGGVTLQAALARPDLIKAAVLWGPISADNQDNFEKWNRDRMTPQATEMFTNRFGSIDDPASFVALSPLTYLDRLQVPILIQHGTADESCPIEWSRELDSALRQTGADYQYLEYEGFPHVFWNEDWDRAINDTTNFLSERL